MTIITEQYPVELRFFGQGQHNFAARFKDADAAREVAEQWRKAIDRAGELTTSAPIQFVDEAGVEYWMNAIVYMRVEVVPDLSLHLREQAQLREAMDDCYREGEGRAPAGVVPQHGQRQAPTPP